MSNMLAIKNGMTVLGRQFVKHAPQIFMVAGSAGVVITGILTAKAAIESSKILEYKREDKRVDFINKMMETGKYEDVNDIPEELIKQASKLTAKEVIGSTWKYWIGPVTSGLATIGCNIGSERSSSMQNAALLTAYNANAEAFKEYVSKNEEVHGEKEHKKVMDEISKDHIQNAVIDETKIYNTGTGNTLIRCAYDGRLFYGDIDKIEKAARDISYDISANTNGLGDLNVSLNDFFDDIGYHDHTEGGDLVGFTPTNLLFIEWGSSYREDLKKAIVEMRFLNNPAPL